MNLNIPQFYQGYVHAGVMLSVVDSTLLSTQSISAHQFLSIEKGNINIYF